MFFHINFVIISSVFTENLPDILIRIVLNQDIDFGNFFFLSTMLSLSLHEEVCLSICLDLV